ncbi:MAG TPA: hypothetical protein VNX47_07705, partial [Nevskia sp.]|nr:hypothetical protein [Nevskia sp.]
MEDKVRFFCTFNFGALSLDSDFEPNSLSRPTEKKRAQLVIGASGGGMVNQVHNVYNGLRQLTGEYQSHSGAVNTST